MVAMLAWALGGALTLVFLYQNIRLSWPQSYFGPTESLVQYFSGSGIRFLIFRFLPPFVVFVAVGIYAPGPATTTVWVTAGTYAAISTLLSVRSSIIDEPGSVRLSGQRIAVLISIVLGLALVAAAATAAASAVAPSAPPLADVAADLIAGLIAAAVAVAYVVSTWNPPARSTDLPNDLVDAIRAIALDSGADPQLAAAIAQVENVQRPKWFRTVERMTARLRRSGTYGLFQVSSKTPLSDLDSCRAAMASLRGVFPLFHNEYQVDWSVQRAAEKHNPDARFAAMVTEYYPSVSVYPVGSTEMRAPDGRPLLDVISAGRFGETIALRGTYWSQTESVVVDLFRTASLGPDEVQPTTVLNESGRSTWRVDFPPDVLRAVVRTIAPLDDCFTSESVELDLRSVDIRRDVTLRVPPSQPASRIEPA